MKKLIAVLLTMFMFSGQAFCFDWSKFIVGVGSVILIQQHFKQDTKLGNITAGLFCIGLYNLAAPEEKKEKEISSVNFEKSENNNFVSYIDGKITFDEYMKSIKNADIQN